MVTSSIVSPLSGLNRPISLSISRVCGELSRKKNRMRRTCRCTVGNCENCACGKENRRCTPQCNCQEDFCVNRQFVFEDPQAREMNNDALNAALGALAAQLDQQGRNQQHIGDTLAALAGRIANMPPPPPLPAPPPVAAQMQATLGTDVVYSGSESVIDWLQLVNRKATSENWNDDQKKRAAIGSLTGPALTWHEQIGINLNGWNDWLQGLRDTFEVQLTEGQWQMMIEGRRQGASETACSYVMEKLKICRRSPTVLTEAQMIPYLIRGLFNPNHMTVVMVNPPNTIANFLAELRRLEALSNFPLGISGGQGTASPPILAPTPKPETTPVNDEILKAVGQLSTQLSILSYKVNAMQSSDKSSQGKSVSFQNDGRASGSILRRPARPETDCWNCQGLGHYARDCPKAKSSENSQAGPQGQGRQ